MRLRLLSAVLLLFGCDSIGVFHCDALKTCTPGYCEATGFCSFDDSGCPSGRRYGDYAGNGLARTCVGVAMLDAPLPDAMTPPDGAGPDVPPMFNPRWWDPAFHARRPLTLYNGAASVLPTGFQVGWPQSIEGIIGSGPFDQVRIVRWTGSWQEMTRVIDANTPTHEWIWIKLAATVSAGGTDLSYWLYYQNASPPAAPSDPAMVFDFYDPFSNATLGAAWTSQGPVNIGNGEVRLDTNGYLRTLASYGPGLAVDWEMRMPTFDFRFWAGFQVAGTFLDNAPWVIWIARGPAAQIWPEYQDNGGGMFVGARVAFNSQAHIYGVDRLLDRVVFRLDDEIAQIYMMAPVTDALNARITNESLQPLFTSMVRIRKTVHPYPQVTLGAVETNP